ncbi:bifunctional oligoribonuclease/PAP phosphatase NrnA [Paenibacillus sp. YN15]|uniref:DHH family phosphoesterase n=1 Tax=Paenibacillus sp. YN15 TaxID=1742774 RepID=UPI000DCB8218|nr:bifunctional oligoribonuclease/PAP phosphatase NrnA [Paenibacillus sp. YN15]RAV03553.1 bifunctional oligoribonuclease/PAP phosphatase NrnA [Paenibacillus sp. YN15]
MSAPHSSSLADAYRKQLDEAKAFIQAHDRFLVVSHVNPDGDAIGSTLAVGQMLQFLGKSFVLVNEGEVPFKFAMLPRSDEILNYSRQGSGSPPPAFDCVIAVDCADYQRIGLVKEWFHAAAPILNIDHHPTNDGFGRVNLIRADAAATAEVLYDLATLLSIRWTKPLADCIYTGLLTDTGGFRYSNTTPRVLQIASEMLEYGVDGNDLADQLLEKLTLSHVMVLQKALAALDFSEDKRIAWVSVMLQDVADSHAQNADLEGLVNYPRNIEGVEVGLLFKQIDEEKWKVSFRSAGLADVAAVAQHFGGGGHIRAAGCTVKGTLGQVVEQVLQEVKRGLP